MDTYFAPNWFFGYDIFLELVFMIILLMVSYYAFKVYKLSEQRQPKLFGLAFLFIAASYFVKSFINFSIISQLNETISEALRIIGASTFNVTGFFIHSALFLVGLVTLVYMILKVESGRIYSLFIILTITALLLTINMLYTFHLLSSIFLIYIIVSYSANYFKKKQKRTLLILIAFIFLLFGSIHFIFSILNSIYYVIGHFLELIAYINILISLILVVRK